VRARHVNRVMRVDLCIVLLVVISATEAPTAWSAQTCVPPPGFVDTPHPKIGAPLLLSSLGAEAARFDKAEIEIHADSRPLVLTAHPNGVGGKHILARRYDVALSKLAVAELGPLSRPTHSFQGLGQGASSLRCSR
jgi:hypothetical protein